MTLIFLVQHAEKEPGPGDPGLTDASSTPVGGSICGHLPAHTW